MLLVQIYILELHFIGELKRGTDSLNDDEHPINTVLKINAEPDCRVDQDLFTFAKSISL